jgi:hypothetical protein
MSTWADLTEQQRDYLGRLHTSGIDTAALLLLADHYQRENRWRKLGPGLIRMQRAYVRQNRMAQAGTGSRANREPSRR